MRYTFLLLFALMFMGLNAVNAQSCCAKASTAATTSSVEKKSCDMAKATTNTASASKCNESATASAQAPSGIAVFVNGLTNFNTASTKACDPSTCDKSKCDLSKCDPANCDPSKCPKTEAMKASNVKVATKTTKVATSL